MRLTPRGGRDAIDGTVVTADGKAWLAVRVRAVPEGGKANAALIRLLAKQLDVAPGAVSLVAGARQRRKRVVVAGEARTLAGRAAALSGGG